MPWVEVLPEQVDDRDTVSFRFREVGPSLAEAWSAARGSKSSERVVWLGVGARGGLKAAPEWWMDSLLTYEQSPYEGGVVQELTATAPLGPRPYGFDEVGAQIWVVLDTQWVPAGSFLELTHDPPWAQDRIGPERHPNAPPLTTPDPLTSHTSLSGMTRVWQRENPQELWFSGMHGWGRRLHSVSVEETPEAVYVTCLIGWTQDYEARVEAAGGSERVVVIPMIGCGWAVCTDLATPLGDRKVLVRNPDP